MSSPGVQRRTPPPSMRCSASGSREVAYRERSSAARQAGEGGCPATKPGARDVARTAGRRTGGPGNARRRWRVGPRRRGCGEAARPRTAAAGGHCGRRFSRAPVVVSAWSVSSSWTRAGLNVTCPTNHHSRGRRHGEAERAVAGHVRGIRGCFAFQAGGGRNRTTRIAREAFSLPRAVSAGPAPSSWPAGRDGAPGTSAAATSPPIMAVRGQPRSPRSQWVCSNCLGSPDARMS